METGVLVQAVIKNRYYVGIGKDEDSAFSDLYDTLYAIFDDETVDNETTTLKERATVFPDVPIDVLFYAAYAYNGEKFTRSGIEELHSELAEDDLDRLWSDAWEDGWDTRLQDEKLK